MYILYLLFSIIFASGFFSQGCVKNNMLGNHTSYGISATTIEDLPKGNYQRCGPELNQNLKGESNYYLTNNIYEKMYISHTNLLAVIFDRFDESGNLDSSIQYSEKGKKILINTRQWMINLFNQNSDGSIPNRPIHPIAFFSVIKDFETSMNYNWGPLPVDHISSGTWDDFPIVEGDCGATRCRGIYQISLAQDSQWQSGWKDMCGDSGLGIVGLPASPDFCAALHWWTMLDYGRKCKNLLANPVKSNLRPNNDYASNVCVPINSVGSAQNLCNTPHNWIPYTFGYGWACAYGQSNQYSKYGIYDVWEKLYTGFLFDNKFKSHNNKQVYGYEQCAIKRFLRKVKKSGACLQGGSDYDPTIRPPAKKLITTAVADFACEINLLPNWIPREYCKAFKHGLSKASKVKHLYPETGAKSCRLDNTVPYLEDFIASSYH